MTHWEWLFVHKTLQKHGYAAPLLDLGGWDNNTFYDNERQHLVAPAGGHIWGGIDTCIFDHEAEKMAEETDLKWHTIISTSTLEHTDDPLTFMRATSKLLAEGGLLVLTAPFCWHEHGDWQDDHWRFTRGGLALLAKRAGLNILELEYNVFSSDRSMTYLIASKGELGERPGQVVIPTTELAD